MSMSYQIRQQLALKFFPKKVSSFWKRAKLAFFCFHRVTKTHQDKIPFSNTNQCGRVDKFAVFQENETFVDKISYITCCLV